MKSVLFSVSSQGQCGLVIGYRPSKNCMEFPSIKQFFIFQVYYQITTYEIPVQNTNQNHQKLVLGFFPPRFKDKPKG